RRQAGDAAQQVRSGASQWLRRGADRPAVVLHQSRRTAMIRLTSTWAAAGLVCTIAGQALGQRAPARSSSDVRGCADTLQARNLTRVTVFQQAALVDTTPAVRAQVDLVAQ